MKEYFRKFNEIRKNPKKRSISLLIIYGIFFIFVFIYISGSKSINTPNEINSFNDSLGKVSNYEYDIEFNINDELISFNGYYLNSENKLNIDSNYTLNNNVIMYKGIIIKYDLIINKLSYNSMDNFIKNYEYESKTEYKDSNIKYEYIINNKDIASYLGEDNKYEGNTNITVYKKDYISEIDIDLSNYYNSKYIIKIKYDSVNNISSVDINNKEK